MGISLYRRYFFAVSTNYVDTIYSCMSFSCDFIMPKKPSFTQTKGVVGSNRQGVLDYMVVLTCIFFDLYNQL